MFKPEYPEEGEFKIHLEYEGKFKLGVIVDGRRTCIWSDTMYPSPDMLGTIIRTIHAIQRSLEQSPDTKNVTVSWYLTCAGNVTRTDPTQRRKND